MGRWVGGWLENDFLNKTSSPKFGLESQLGTSDFGVCQMEGGESRPSLMLLTQRGDLGKAAELLLECFLTVTLLRNPIQLFGQREEWPKMEEIRLL